MYNCIKHGLQQDTYNYCKICEFEKYEISTKWTKNKEQPKMTREEALNKLKTIKTPLSVENIVDILEEVGLLEFEEEKKDINVLFNYGVNASDYYDQDTPVAKVVKQYGTIRLEEWTEGLVLWVGGEIKWKSWGAPLPK